MICGGQPSAATVHGVVHIFLYDQKWPTFSFSSRDTSDRDTPSRFRLAPFAGHLSFFVYLPDLQNYPPKTPTTGTATYESTSTTNGIKRARKKKSYDELKEEETSLLKERTNLRKEIATLQTTFKEQRAKNENLKRVKLDLNLHSSATNLIAYFDGAENAIASQPHQRIAPPSFGHFPSHLLSHATPYVHPYPQLDSCDEHKAASSSGNNSFVLPDLNMVPFEEDSGSEMLYGMS